ncbi:MAG: ECF transporter S component [Clostridiales Family XIII bacterium]|jgi:riboflavin transporter FmnP|nr:ECF transporter S component [Clostridiales Family XIII bacterium]
MSNANINSRTQKLAKMGLMTGIAVIFSFIHFPILPAAPFLEFEVSDIPIIIAAFAFGPLPGLVIGVASILLHDLMMGPASGPYGMIMHIIAIGVFVLVAGGIYEKAKGFQSKKWGLAALIIGGLCMAGAMIPANLLITPHFMVTSVEFVKAMVLPVILPFNLLKMAINTAVVFVLYKRLSPFLHKW